MSPQLRPRERSAQMSKAEAQDLSTNLVLVCARQPSGTSSESDVVPHAWAEKGLDLVPLGLERRLGI